MFGEQEDSFILACGYAEIRKEFPVKKHGSYAGFDLEEELEED